MECVGHQFGEEDIRLWIDDKLVIMEVTGSKNAVPEDDKIFQITKHVPVRQHQYPNLKVFGSFIMNHDNLNTYEKRGKPFDERINNFAKHSKISIITTTDLLNAFIKYKKGQIKPGDIIEGLCIPGVLKLKGTIAKTSTNKPDSFK